MSLRVVFVSHQHLLRSLLCERLVKTFGAVVVLECSSAEQLKNARPHLRTVDLLIVDADLADGSPLAAIQAVLRFRPALKIALMTDTPGAYLVESAIRLGLRGILHKRDTAETFLQGTKTIFAGGIWISPLVDHGGRTAFGRVLSPREVDVLSLLAQGHGAKRAAGRLKISSATILTHKRNIMGKLGLGSQVALVLFALRSGLVTADQIGGDRR